MNKKLNKIKSYKYGEQPKNKKFIKLNTNENSFPPTIKTIKNIIKEIMFFGNKLKFYPNPNNYKLKKSISLFYKIKINQIFIGNGSDEILALSFLTFLKKKILNLNDISYSFYESYIKLYKIKYKIIKLNKNLSIDINKYKDNVGNIIITNPNAPTGKLLKLNEIEYIILNNLSSIIIIDEAYIDFGGESSINFIKKYKNILIIQTLSKSRSLAGIRVGLCIGNWKLIKKLNIIKNSFNTYPVNIISENIAISSFEDNNYFEKIKERVINNRNYLIKMLNKFDYKLIQSKSNFILFKNNEINIYKLIKKIKKKGIIVRRFEIPRIENFIRVTIGGDKECLKFIKTLK